jgi:hypothetical protein
LSLGCGETLAEIGCVVPVPELVPDDLFVGTDVVSELALGVRWDRFLSYNMQYLFFSWELLFLDYYGMVWRLFVFYIKKNIGVRRSARTQND